MNRMPVPSPRARGFTLIEAIVAIVVTSIVFAIVAVFIRAPVEGYVDSARRAQLTDQADVALRRLARDVRLALPNSLRVTTTGGIAYIEFIITRAGGRYRDPADGSTAGDFLSFTDATDVTFDVLGKNSNAATDADYIAPGDYIVVYNLGPGYAPADAYDGGNIAQVDAAAPVNCGTPCTVTLAANPFASQSPALPSPSARFQVVPGNVQAVTYACPTVAAGDFVRYWNYGIATPPPALAGGSSALLSQQATCTVDYATAATGRSGLLYIHLRLTDASGEAAELFQQIHVDNSP